MPRPRKAQPRPEDLPTILEASLRPCGTGLPRSALTSTDPRPTGRPRLDACSTPSCSGCATARARTEDTTEASSYG